MRILFTSLRTPSHFMPLLPFIQACLTHGHEVALAAPEDLREPAEKAGVQLLPLEHPGDEGMRPYWTRMREVPPAERNRFVVSEIFAGVCARSALASLLAAATQFEPQLIVRETLEFASLVVAEKLGVPHARVGIVARGAERPNWPAATAATNLLRQASAMSPLPDFFGHAQGPLVYLPRVSLG